MKKNGQLCKKSLQVVGVDIHRRWIIIHPGVSEEKRRHPEDCWTEAATGLLGNGINQVLITGAASEQKLTERLQQAIGPFAISLGGKLSLEEFILLIQHAPLLISVNTASIHFAAATGTPVIVLYALTNPQHTPWKGLGKMLLFDVKPELRSKNEIIRYVYENMMYPVKAMVAAKEIVEEAKKIIMDPSGVNIIPQLVPLRDPVN